jgi:hypothetical protein
MAVLSTRGVSQVVQTGRVRPDPSEIVPIEPDTKDWTWTLQRECPDCGFDAQRLDIAELPQLLRDHALAWGELLSRPGVTERPASDVWSPLEYACHVRDVHRRFDERVGLMLHEVDPEFANWDQDATAVAEDYYHQDPATVALELVAAAGTVAGRYAAVTGDQWARRGRRSDGSEFTVESISRYHAHDMVHHAHDVGLDVTRGGASGTGA